MISLSPQQKKEVRETYATIPFLKNFAVEEISPIGEVISSEDLHNALKHSYMEFKQMKNEVPVSDEDFEAGNVNGVPLHEIGNEKEVKEEQESNEFKVRSESLQKELKELLLERVKETKTISEIVNLLNKLDLPKQVKEEMIDVIEEEFKKVFNCSFKDKIDEDLKLFWEHGTVSKD